MRSGLNVVLVEPEIPWNTGNIGRTCVGTGTTLHLVGRLGFRIDGKEIRRSGLDYWPRLKLVLHKNFDAFLESLPPSPKLFLFSTKAKASFWDAAYEPGCYLIFGQESKGLPESLRERFGAELYKIPIGDGIRSLNLSTSAGVALFEAIRQTRGRTTEAAR